jgi:hypothetical protein
MPQSSESWVKASKPPGSEQRRWTRFLCAPGIRCSLLAGSTEPCSATVRNISAGGASLIVGHKIPLGTVLNIQLKNAVRNYSCDQEMRVVYSIEDAKGAFVLGGSFTNELTKDDLQQLL